MCADERADCGERTHDIAHRAAYPGGSKPPLHTTQGHHIVKTTRVPASDRRQQPAVKAAESLAEELPFDWVRVDLQGVALQGQDENVPAL